jgi:hypothetical protein
VALWERGGGRDDVCCGCESACLLLVGGQCSAVRGGVVFETMWLLVVMMVMAACEDP